MSGLEWKVLRQQQPSLIALEKRIEESQTKANWKTENILRIELRTASAPTSFSTSSSFHHSPYANL